MNTSVIFRLFLGLIRIILQFLDIFISLNIFLYFLVNQTEHNILTWYQSCSFVILIALTSSNSQPSSNFLFTTLVKLDCTNYTIWRQQVLSSICGNGLECYIDGSKLSPDQYMPSKSGFASYSNTEAQENPKYGAWKR